MSDRVTGTGDGGRGILNFDVFGCPSYGKLETVQNLETLIRCNNAMCAFSRKCVFFLFVKSGLNIRQKLQIKKCAPVEYFVQYWATNMEK